MGVSIRCKFAEQVFSPAEFSALHVYSHSSFSSIWEIANTCRSLSWVIWYFSLFYTNKSSDFNRKKEKFLPLVFYNYKTKSLSVLVDRI